MILNKFIKTLKQLPRHSLPPKGKGRSYASYEESRQPFSRAIEDEVPGGTTSNVTTAQVEALAQAKANEIISEMQQAQTLSKSGRTYSRFDFVNDIVDNQTAVITAGLWSDNVGSLSTYYTSSVETTSQRRYYINVYQKNPGLTGSAVQFACAYGNAVGSGSSALGTQEDPASKAVYAQYKQLLLEPNDTRFTTAGSGSTDSIYAVNVQRNRVKEQLDAGNWQLPLTTITSHDQNATGSVAVAGKTLTLIDDSSVASATVGSTGNVYNIVSGSIDNGVYTPTSPIYYGLFYPQYGTMILDGKMLDQDLSFATNLSASNAATAEGDNHFLLFHSISGSLGSSVAGFEARNQEKITSTHYFVRIKNGEFNFSNNPSFTTGSVGAFSQTSFVGDPKTYVTTIGLYNDQQELLAVAKLSKPLLKTFSREALVKVKLNF